MPERPPEHFIKYESLEVFSPDIVTGDLTEQEKLELDYLKDEYEYQVVDRYISLLSAIREVRDA